MSSAMKAPRHIQDFSVDSELEYHWGYASRQVPCLNDAGSCAYLDAVYHEHDLGMMYTFILWAVICGLLFLWVLGRKLLPLARISTPSKEQLLEDSRPKQNSFYRFGTAAKAFGRRHLLPESLTGFFGHTTRLQIGILTIIIAYLTIFTFVGITYKKWVTPVKNSPGVYNTRTGLGPWSDRIGILAFALTPLSVLLSSRESLLSMITGIPYHHFMFLHRWIGWIIFIQSALHTLGWTIVEARLYQPQPTVWNEWVAQVYIIWGIVAMILLSIMVTFSTQWGIRLTGYEFFRKSHYVLAMVYIGACWGHWVQLYCWMIASLLVWFFDRGVRLVRTFALHHFNTPNTISALGLHVPEARMTLFERSHDGDVVRLDFEHNHDEWKIGQHFFLCFPDLTLWQSHPMTPLSVPGQNPRGQNHTYIIRTRKGITKQLADIARNAQLSAASPIPAPTTSVVLSGPYGQSILSDDFYREDDVNVMCIAGGTGVTFVLPVLLALTRTPRRGNLEFVWAIRRKDDLKWIEPELQTLRRAAAATSNFRIRIFVTRGTHDNPTPTTTTTTNAEYESKEAAVQNANPSSISSSSSTEMKQDTFSVHEPSSSASLSSGNTKHPDLATQLTEFISRTVSGPTRVVASGPLSMIRDLRSAVAQCNDAGRVWKGEERFDVQLVHDDRLEY
ncbi:ferric reductase like transmembrane component-domain-containing protein [Aspergillus pseudodeflectus]|uniref:Ferric reductase like transmembrane component-domain-containing protein n=1 Tax=Aspergillus pseudodeflectus TaxID=176178 RepID=A0ABR4K7B7_9EURO